MKKIIIIIIPIFIMGIIFNLQSGFAMGQENEENFENSVNINLEKMDAEVEKNDTADENSEAGEAIKNNTNESDEEADQLAETGESEEIVEQDEEESDNEQIEQEIAASNHEIKELNIEIQSKKKQIDEINNRQKIYERVLKQKQNETASLTNQLAILENKIAKTELDIESVEVDIDRVNLEIKKVNLEIDSKDLQINKEKDHISTILRLLHKQDSQSTLEIILLNNSFTDFINQIKYLEDINSEISDSLDDLKEYKIELEDQKIGLNDKISELAVLKKEIENKKVLLNSEEENKAFILTQTKESEKEYQKLLAEAKAEQEQAEADIVSLEKAVRAKLAKLEDQTLKLGSGEGFIWPVPKNVITSYFHDPDYPFRYIYEHPAVDIRARQGTNLKAASSGYVARAKDAGKGYSYIMIVHGDGLATVYGHVSKIYVKEDEYVVQGQTIGLTGGLPGTNGAGRLTTGPHLHFEVRLNGIPVNPLEYLP